MSEYCKNCEALLQENEKLKTKLDEYKNSINKGDRIINQVMNMRLEQHDNIIDDLKQQLQATKQALEPFQDEYFKGLDTKQIAELAKKSIRLTTENRKLECVFDEIEKFMHYEFCGDNEWVRKAILDIISKAKGG